MSEVLIVAGSIFLSFLLGVGMMGFFAGVMTLKYLVVKFSRGRKVLVFADTQTGRKILVGKFEGSKKRGTVSWKWLGDIHLTETQSNNFKRYYAVDYIALNVDTPEVPYDLSALGETPKKSIDPIVYNNIYERLLTAPVVSDSQGKWLKIAFFVLLGIAGGVVMLYLKVVDVHQIVTALGVI